MRQHGFGNPYGAENIHRRRDIAVCALYLGMLVELHSTVSWRRLVQSSHKGYLCKTQGKAEMAMVSLRFKVPENSCSIRDEQTPPERD
jgi:hypothetical protein